MPEEHGCTHEVTIREIALNMQHVGDTLMGMKQTQERLVLLLETVATQDARLDHLEDHQEKTFQDVQNLYGRMRDVELVVAAGGLSKLRESVDDLSEKVTATLARISRVNTFLKWVTHKYAIIVYLVLIGMITMSFLSDIIYHKEFVQGVWKFWKGVI